MQSDTLTRFRPLVEEALEAFVRDSAYAEDMARQAGALRARQELRQEKEA